ncbi:hypothetical protein OSB04_017025 [Centaurea solstitialis]|uniref:Uncharacterized protein n=1 Tax=Centaurea solstitialis TaxID=347529 RepID=A0AA38WI07_9ASTR|nr:hypothetical protein OSB04_017025 [Centaurea solstitialis]
MLQMETAPPFFLPRPCSPTFSLLPDPPSPSPNFLDFSPSLLRRLLPNFDGSNRRTRVHVTVEANQVGRMYVTVEVIEEPAYYHGGLGILLVVYDVTNELPFNSNCFNLSSTNIGCCWPCLKIIMLETLLLFLFIKNLAKDVVAGGKNEGSNVCDIPIDWPLLTTEDIRMGVMKRSDSCDRLDGVDDEPMSEVIRLLRICSGALIGFESICSRLFVDGFRCHKMQNDVKVAIPGLASVQLSNDNDIKVQQAGVTLRAWYRLD